MKQTSWIEVVTGIGVILSLIFVATEIRSNTKAVRGATMQGIADQSIQVTTMLISSPALGAAYAKASRGEVQSLTTDEEDQLDRFYAGVMRVAENRYRQRALGTFENTAMVGGGSTSYRIPFFKAWWQARRFLYPADFAAYVDSTLIPLGMDSVPRVIKR